MLLLKSFQKPLIPHPATIFLYTLHF